MRNARSEFAPHDRYPELVADQGSPGSAGASSSPRAGGRPLRGRPFRGRSGDSDLPSCAAAWCPIDGRATAGPRVAEPGIDALVAQLGDPGLHFMRGDIRWQDLGFHKQTFAALYEAG